MNNMLRSAIRQKNCLGRFTNLINGAAKYSSASQDLVSVTEDDSKKVAIVKMQRAPVNSLNMELMQQITSTIKDLENKKFRGIILASSSPTVFSAGLDIMELYKPKTERICLFWKSLQDMWKTLYLTPLVTIAAVNGHAPAGGCLITLSCDYSIMVNGKYSIGLNETQLGIAAPQWFKDLYVSTIGFRQAEQALNLGTLFKPEKALSLKIVDELVANDKDLMSRAQEEMERWLKIPRLAREATKLSLRKPAVDKLVSYEKLEVEGIVQHINQEATQKALGKYVEGLKNKKA